MELTPRFPTFLHGGDYNPDQWLDHPEILHQDIEMMKRTHVNCVSLGIFAWAQLEPEEGKYDFAWMDDLVERLWASHIHVCLATPSGARPAWMADKYPEVLRWDRFFRPRHFGGRHNHCPSSPVYQEKVTAMDEALARRYAAHPAVILWHLSNEFSGDCYCPRCQEAFRAYLRERYGTIENLNRSWYTSFWSAMYTSFDQIEPPGPMGQESLPAMKLDWRRFSTLQCRRFIEMEKRAVRRFCPDLPCTANLMEDFHDYDYFELSGSLDLVSWDCYPAWGRGDNTETARNYAMNHDMMRSFLDRPFLLMESTPSLVNWKKVNQLKRPGMHLLSSMQAVAHGAQSVMYFQWRKGRGGAEMFHGAVMDHDLREDTRVIRDVTEVGLTLERLSHLYHAPLKRPQVCILYDWNTRWALDYAEMGMPGNMGYLETVREHYGCLYEQGISVDFRNCERFDPDEGYALVIAPMLFMFSSGIEDRLRRYVEQGGTLVMTYVSGMVDGTDQAFLGPTPYGLTDVLGIAYQELDALYPEERNHALYRENTLLEIRDFCSIIQAGRAQVLASYTDDFYAGSPCITRSVFGLGHALYMAARLTPEGLARFYQDLLKDLGILSPFPHPLPHGVIVTRRADHLFLQNYSGREVRIPTDRCWKEMIHGQTLRDCLVLPVNGLLILRSEA